MAVPWTIEGKVCIITGSSNGIGRQTALELVLRGARKVILACQNLDAVQEAAKDIRAKCLFSETEGQRRVVACHLDLASFESVRKFAFEINATEPQLHVLVNNADLEVPNKKQVTTDGNELTFQTNHLGQFLLTNLLLDLMKRSQPSRIVVAASTSYAWALPFGLELSDVNQEKSQRYCSWWTYAQSKLANILFARKLHQLLNGDEPGAQPKSGISVFSLHTGCARSGDYLRNRESVSWLDYVFLAAVDVIQGAQTPVYCCCQPGIEADSGQFFDKCQPAFVWWIARDDAKANALWELSEKIVNKPSKPQKMIDTTNDDLLND